MSAQAVSETVSTRIPARMDRLPWTAWHWRIIIALGTVWILDGLEVTIVGSISARLQEKDTLGLTTYQATAQGSIYVAGACVGAVLFGILTDRLGRKKLFLWTLSLYLVATIATAFTGSFWTFAICRFFTGMGIGGECGRRRPLLGRGALLAGPGGGVRRRHGAARGPCSLRGGSGDAGGRVGQPLGGAAGQLER